MGLVLPKSTRAEGKRKKPGWIQIQVNHVSLEIVLLLTQRGRKGKWCGLFCRCACCPFPFFINAAAQQVGAATESGRGCRGSRERAYSRALSPPSLRLSTKERKQMQTSKGKKSYSHPPSPRTLWWTALPCCFLCSSSTSPNSDSSKKCVCVFLETYINRHSKWLDEEHGQA